MSNKFLVIIPVYNEEKHIRSVIEKIKTVFKSRVDILVVNDASTDQSLNIIQEMKVDFINLLTRLPYGAVIQTGFKYALFHNYDYVGLLDGDGQHDPYFLKPMLSLLRKEQNDLIIGSRFLKHKYKMPIIKRLGTYIFSFFIRLLTHKEISDPTSGFQVFNRAVLEYYCRDLFPVDYPDADIIIRLLYQKFRIKEFPVKMELNLEKSMHSFWSSFYYIGKMFLSIFIIIIDRKKR